ncbi:hypothetical protein KI809_11150 [Geobacter pelophilus]|uniref:Uncharacterized protein n=1 Tax=Geoanaerobacter pelophilus TaxID=60036 RepID=A0AAW4L1W7_9BACT|nr:hypothetical protein [Geoanaerobacter pelophilus]MBT0664858.1 hypothetical protein [Geoanaerobacter pelophilus]
MKQFGYYLRELTLTERMIIVYMALPVAVFYLGWLKPMIGILCAVLLGLLICSRLKKEFIQKDGSLSLTVIASAILLAACWSCLGGAGHLFYANNDWPVRDAVLRDLVVYPWPVTYSISADNMLLLRAPLGYYLFPALLGKIIGLKVADYLLLGWTILGTTLLFLHLCASCRKNSHALLTISVFIFFSGMDIVGSLIMNAPVAVTTYMEYWAEYFQYPSMTTLLFWVPNHGLSGWLAASLFIRHWKNSFFLPIAFFLVTITPLWSPFTAIGVMLLFIASLLYHIRHGNWKHLLVPETGVATLIALPIVHYLTIQAAQVASGGAILSVLPTGEFFYYYTFFVCLELAVVPLILTGEIKYRSGNSWLIASTFFYLLLLPFFYYAPTNELVMRCSIPLLAVIAIRTSTVLVAFMENRAYALAVLTVAILLIGAATPAWEIARALQLPRWRPDLATNLVTATNAEYRHYYTRVQPQDFPWELKKPAHR